MKRGDYVRYEVAPRLGVPFWREGRVCFETHAADGSALVVANWTLEDGNVARIAVRKVKVQIT